MKKTILLAAALLCVAIGPRATFANDSEAEFALGGLTLKQSEHISMDSEDLYISKDLVRVKYRFTNHSDKDVRAMISFPLPALPDDRTTEWLYQSPPDFEQLKFETLVDGKPAPLSMVTRAMIGDRDVSEVVTARGWPINWLSDYEFTGQFDKLSDPERRTLVEAGLIRKVEDYEWTWIPAWKIARHVTREQTFPAHQTVSVEHTYAPLIGGSVGGSLLKDVRENDPEIAAHYRKRHCVDDAFLNGLDRRDAAQRKIGGLHSETWIGYVLSSGANWKGPIKDFRLVIDKGSAKNLVSFCMNGVKKISPTQFEIRKTNFEPKDDLNILIVEWFDPNS